MNTTTIGAKAETRALRYLQRRGFKLVTRNYRAKTGEIDLIVSRNDTLVFVEVRLRMNPAFGSGADSITPRKRQRIINTARLYLQGLKSPPWRYYRFDVVSIGDEVDWIPHAFTLD